MTFNFILTIVFVALRIYSNRILFNITCNTHTQIPNHMYGHMNARTHTHLKLTTMRIREIIKNANTRGNLSLF